MIDDHDDQIYSRVVQAISDVSGVAPSELNGDVALISDLNLDSLAMYEIVIDLEEAFKMQISDEEIERIGTIKDIVLFIKRQAYHPRNQE
jgi:acyl carrier protein